MIGEIISAVIGAAVSAYELYTAKKNKDEVEKTNEENIARAEEWTEKQWARDDNQFQRAVKDAEAAGLSPLAAISNGGGNTAAITSVAQAPQMDLSGLIGLATSSQDLLENTRHNKETEEISREEIEAETDRLNKTLEKNMEIAELNNDKAWERLQKQIEQQNKTLTETTTKREQEYDMYISEQTAKTWEEIGNKYGFTPNVEHVTDWAEYQEKLLKAQEKLNGILKEYAKTAAADKYGSNSSTSYGQGTNFSTGVKVVGTGVDVGVGSNYNESQSQGQNTDITRINSAKLAEMCKDLYWPIYIGTFK